ncbi:exported hypothetical protein [uncultured Desulfatiglans sp.]|nr:exported hypothetical protein [uncultured Desulfatiglans sp.]
MRKVGMLKMVLAFSCCWVLLLSVGAAAESDAPCPIELYPEYVQIVAAPNVLNLENEGQWVTIHTDIPYSQVLGESVMLNSIPISWDKYDNRGYYVAKFAMSSVKDILYVGDYNTLTFTGMTIEAEAFCGFCEIFVKQVIPTGK